MISGSIVDETRCINEVSNGWVKDKNHDVEEGAEWSDVWWIGMILCRNEGARNRAMHEF